MKFNTPIARPIIVTHEGGRAVHIKPDLELRRSVLSCLLWENEFYENGQTIAERITELADLNTVDFVAALAIEARHVHGLRHAPLLLLLNLIKRGGPIVGETIARTIRRADEMAELVALYWHFNPGKDLSKQMKIGLARRFAEFDEYQLAKYDREGAVRLRDVMFLSHPTPRDEEQAALFKRVANRELVTPDTWETELSAGKDKRETFERLIREGKLGYLALLRNLRNMVQAGCDMALIKDAIRARNGAAMVWPFRYTAAARIVPQLEPELDWALRVSIEEGPKMTGDTIVLVDVSGSMDAKLSAKSDLTRLDAAATLASVINANLRVFTFSERLMEIPPRRGMAGVDAIIKSQPHDSTYLGAAVEKLNQMPHDRLIVITDEQTSDRVPDPVAKHAYMINVASSKNGVGYRKWVHLDGFSESVIRWIVEREKGLTDAG